MALAQQAKRATPAAPPAPAYVSMSPDNFTHGGLIDDIDITIADAQTCVFDYNGSADPNTPTLAVEYVDPNGVSATQYYSLGKPEDWQPTEDGHGFQSVSGKTGINDSTNLGMFLESLVEHGFPKDLLDAGDLKCIIGLKAHVNQKVTERTGLVRTGKNAARPSQVLLVTKIIALPGAKGTTVAAGKAAATKAVGGKANGAAKAATATAAAAAATDDMDAKITEVLQAALAELGEGEAIPKKEIGKLVFNTLKAEAALPMAQVNKHVARANAADFLASLAEVGMVFEGAELKLATE